MTLLLIEMISVFDSEVSASGFGAPSEAAPNAFQRWVSLGDIWKLLIASMCGSEKKIGSAPICGSLKVPEKLADVNSLFTVKSGFTVTVLPPVLIYV